jgi:hypothetical protein
MANILDLTGASFFVILSARTEASRRGEAKNPSSIEVQPAERFFGEKHASE